MLFRATPIRNQFKRNSIPIRDHFGTNSISIRDKFESGLRFESERNIEFESWAALTPPGSDRISFFPSFDILQKHFSNSLYLSYFSLFFYTAIFLPFCIAVNLNNQNWALVARRMFSTNILASSLFHHIFGYSQQKTILFCSLDIPRKKIKSLHIPKIHLGLHLWYL